MIDLVSRQSGVLGLGALAGLSVLPEATRAKRVAGAYGYGCGDAARAGKRQQTVAPGARL